MSKNDNLDFPNIKYISSSEVSDCNAALTRLPVGHTLIFLHVSSHKYIVTSL